MNIALLVMSRNTKSEVKPSILVGWADGADVVHGYDAADLCSSGVDMGKDG